MDLTPEEVNGLNLAVNEASMLRVTTNRTARIVEVELELVRPPLSGEAQAISMGGRRFTLILRSVGRIAFSYRLGKWDDRSAQTKELADESTITNIVASFGQMPIYGAKFFDVPEKDDFAQWSDRLSLDVRWGEDGLKHTVDLFQEASDPSRHLDMRIWFDKLEIHESGGERWDIDRFATLGEELWKEF